MYLPSDAGKRVAEAGKCACTSSMILASSPLGGGGLPLGWKVGAAGLRRGGDFGAKGRDAGWRLVGGQWRWEVCVLRRDPVT